MKAKAAQRCSFCKKGLPEVHWLFHGPRVYICDRCIVLCVKFLIFKEAEEGGPRAFSAMTVSRLLEKHGFQRRRASMYQFLLAWVAEREGTRGDALENQLIDNLAHHEVPVPIG